MNLTNRNSSLNLKYHDIQPNNFNILLIEFELTNIQFNNFHILLVELELTGQLCF
jgi:hypothetical protein